MVFSRKAEFRVFGGRVCFEQGRFSGGWGDLRGLCAPVRPHCSLSSVARKRAVCRVSVISGDGLRRPDDQKDTAKPSPALDGILRDSFATRHAVARWQCPETRRIASKLDARDLTFPQTCSKVYLPLLIGLARHLCSLRQDRADGFLLSRRRLADGLADTQTVGFLFSRRRFDFWGFGCKLYGPF